MTVKGAPIAKEEAWLYALKLFAFAVIYIVSARLGLSLAFINASATLVWPPTAIAFVALLFFGYRLWPAVFVGAFFANLMTAGTAITSLFIASGNTLEAVVGVYLVTQFAGGRDLFEKPENVLRFIFFAALGSTAVSASIGLMTLLSGGLANPTQVSSIWFTWWLGDASSHLILTPLLVFLLISKEKLWRPKMTKEGAVALVLLLGVGAISFGALTFDWAEDSALGLLIFPLMFWAAFNCGRRETAFAVVALSFFAVWGLLIGHGPFREGAPNETLFAVQVFICLNALVALLINAVVAQREKTHEELQEKTRDLEVETILLAEAKAKDDALLLSMGDGVVAADVGGNIIFVNKKAESMLGYSEKEMIGKPFFDICISEQENGERVAKEARAFSAAIALGKPVITSDHFYLRKNKTRFPAMVSAAPIRNSRLEGAVVVIRDITKEKEIDRAKDEFISLASHQLRTPLTITNWYGERLLSGKLGPLSRPQKKYASEIYRANQRMSELVNALLNVSRLELGTFAIEPEPVRVHEVIEELLHELKPQTKKRKLKISTEFPRPFAVLRADPRLLRIIIQNLVNNAVKYTPVGGEIKIAIESRDPDLFISVEDSGYGIPAAEQDKIFARMYRASNAKKIDPDGSGLGLYIVKTILERSGGQVTFVSKEGKGSRFVVSLPLGGMKSKAGEKPLE